MKAALKIAQDYVKALATNAVILDLETIINERKVAIDGKVLESLKTSFPRFKCMLDQWKPGDPLTGDPLTPAQYLDRDTFSLKAHLLWEYSNLTDRLCCGATVSPVVVPGTEQAPAQPAIPPPADKSDALKQTQTTSGVGRQGVPDAPLLENPPNTMKSADAASQTAASAPAAPKQEPLEASPKGTQVLANGEIPIESGKEPCKDERAACQRLKAKESEFFAYLDTDVYESLRIAQLFVTEMRQDFYPKALLCEANVVKIHADPLAPPEPKKSDISVKVDALVRFSRRFRRQALNEIAALPETLLCKANVVKTPADPPAPSEPKTSGFSVKVDVPVRFSLRFERQALNEIAALQEWTCYWEFSDGTARQSGWDVYHMYETKGKFPLSVTLMDLAGCKISQGASEQVTVQSDSGSSSSLERRPAWLRRMTSWSPEAKVEASRLAFALGIALAGIYAAARGKAESLDVFQAAGALIALGFGVDIIKTLLTQKSAQS